MGFLKSLFGRAPAEPAGAWAAPDRGRPRVGIVTAYTTRKGLCTLARSIESVLEPKASVFPARKIRRLDEAFEREKADEIEEELRHPLVAPAGTPFPDWLARHEIVVFIERLHPRIFRTCRESGIRTVLVALLDYLPEEEPVRREGMRDLDRVVVHSEEGARRLREDGVPRVTAVPPGLDWPCLPARPLSDRTLFYFNIGVGGPHNRRNAPMVLETFNGLLAGHPEAHLVVKMLPQARKQYPDFGQLHPSIEVIEGRRSRAEMLALQQAADVSLFPSRFEGLGYPLLESLHSGVPVVATDGPPMNEIIREGENGLLIRARPAATHGLQTVWDLDPGHFRSQVERLLGEEGRPLLSRLKEGAARGNRERQEAFRAGWERVISELRTGSPTA